MPTVKYKAEVYSEKLSELTGYNVVLRKSYEDSTMRSFVAADNVRNCWCEVGLSSVMLEESIDMAANFIKKAMDEKYESLHASKTS